MVEKSLPLGLNLFQGGKLMERIFQASSLIEDCQLCPKLCHVNRRLGKAGACLADERILVSSAQLHWGEEPPITGKKGSGTIFFSNCPMKCVFCQNWQISQKRHGFYVSSEELAGMMLELQRKGAHNINLVSPTHYVPQILVALENAYQRGFHLPLVYNSNGYDHYETIRLLEGSIDIYLPDLKYGNDALGFKYSKSKNYNRFATLALEEMYRQVGNLRLDEQDVAMRGLLVRHLILPGHVENSFQVLDFLAGFISTKVHLSLMSQYHPVYRTLRYPEIDRTINLKAYNQVLHHAEQLGSSHLWAQEPSSYHFCLPDFESDNVFHFEDLDWDKD